MRSFQETPHLHSGTKPMESSLSSAQQGGIQDSHIKSTLSISPDEYMNDRVVYKINKYVEKSERQKIYYQVTSYGG